MKLLSTLKGRIFLASTLLAVLSIGFAIRFVTVRVAREAEAELQRGLAEAGALVQQHYAARVDTLTLLARLIADLPKLKAAVETGDPPTVHPLALDYKARVKSDLFGVTNRSGEVLAAIGASGGAMGDVPAVQSALAGREAATFRPQADGVLQLVTVPIMIGTQAPEVLGTLSLGFALNDALATQFKAVTESEVAFALEGRIRASTLADNYDDDLARLLQTDGIASVYLGGNEYVALRRPLSAPAASEAPVAIILRSRTERLAFLRTFRAALIVAALVAVLVAILLSYTVARTVTRPLATITAAMREMTATGDLTRKIRLGRAWEDEDARLLATAFNTLTDSIARFQREAALRERLSALGRLSTVIAHEIRNPLMIIKACLRSLRREGISAQEIREAAADIDHEVTRLNRIVGDVLDFARPVQLEYAATDVNALCREAASATMVGETAPAFRLSLDPGLPTVITDGDRLRAALVNILSNARDAVLVRPSAAAARDERLAVVSPAMNVVYPPPAIEIRTLALPEGRVAIVVEDSGVGIDPADLPHIFDPYFTTKRTGTGLGLAIAKNIVDSLGGTLSAVSQPSKGSQLRIELPASAGSREALRAAPASSHQPS